MTEDRPPAAGKATFAVGDRIHHPQKGMARVLAARDGIVVARFDDGETREIISTHPGMRLVEPLEEGRISPPWAELQDPERFLPPLTSGELQLSRYLDEVLPAEWRIYVRPHLDADRPLLAALHPSAGGMFWDVVDWELSTFRVENGLWISGNRRFASPFRFMNEVRGRVYGVYVPEIGEAIMADRSIFSVIMAAVYFPRATTSVARALAANDPAAQGITTLGYDTLDPSTPFRVAPVLQRQGRLRAGWFEALDATLTHARRVPDAMSVVQLTPEQQRRARPRPGYTAIHGVAGSGKTLILAYRAAAAAAEGKRVLVLTYNRTLTNYVRGLLQRVPYAYRPDRIAVLHFHDLCKRIRDHYRAPIRGSLRIDSREDELDDSISGDDAGLAPDQVEQRLLDEFLDVRWPDSALALLDEAGVPEALRFDLVLVDEGQDFGESWFSVIKALGAGEVAVAYDDGQRLYERTSGLSSGAIGRMFGMKSSRPASMRKVVRLPATAVRLASDFAARWSLPTLPLEPAEEGLLPPPGTIAGLPAQTEAAAAGWVVALLEAWRMAPDFQSRDVAIVVPNVRFGSVLVLLLAERGFSSNHVFPVASTGALMDEGDILDRGAPWRIAQARKIAFSHVDCRLKVSTVHSFKGWEARRVVLVLSFGEPSEHKAAVAYVGLTRARGDLAIVGRLQDYGLEQLPTLSGISIDPRVALRFRVLLDEVTTESSGASASSRRSAGGTRREARP